MAERFFEIITRRIQTLCKPFGFRFTIEYSTDFTPQEIKLYSLFVGRLEKTKRLMNTPETFLDYLNRSRSGISSIDYDNILIIRKFLRYYSIKTRFFSSLVLSGLSKHLKDQFTFFKEFFSLDDTIQYIQIIESLVSKVKDKSINTKIIVSNLGLMGSDEDFNVELELTTHEAIHSILFNNGIAFEDDYEILDEGLCAYFHIRVFFSFDKTLPQSMQKMYVHTNPDYLLSAHFFQYLLGKKIDSEIADFLKNISKRTKETYAEFILFKNGLKDELEKKLNVKKPWKKRNIADFMQIPNKKIAKNMIFSLIKWEFSEREIAFLWHLYVLEHRR